MFYQSIKKIMESQRDWVVSELEQMFKQYGSFIQKSSLEIESQLFIKARTSEEYMTLARRLLRHMLELARQRHGKAQSKREIPEEAAASPPPPPPVRSDTEGPNPFRLFSAGSAKQPPASPVRVSQAPAATEPSTVFAREVFPVSVASDVRCPPLPVQPDNQDIFHESVRLPAPNKRTFVVTTGSSRKLPPGSQRTDVRPTEDEPTELITRLIQDVQNISLNQTTGTDTELSVETYEASFKFLVPRNAVIKQITIHLKKCR